MLLLLLGGDSASLVYDPLLLSLDVAVYDPLLLSLDVVEYDPLLVLLLYEEEEPLLFSACMAARWAARI